MLSLAPYGVEFETKNHCYTRNADMASRTIIWQPAHGRASQGRPAFTFIDSLNEDVGLASEVMIR